MMLLDLAETEGGPRSFDFTISHDALDLEDESVRMTGDLAVSGEAVRHIAQVDVVGNIRGEAEIDCTRCLKPVPWPIAIDFKASFISPEHFATDKEREVAAEDLDVDVLQDERIDVENLVREQILLNLPEQTFCRPDCKGLCPRCGADLNLLDCKCHEEETDPRWEALKNLK